MKTLLLNKLKIEEQSLLRLLKTNRETQAYYNKNVKFILILPSDMYAWIQDEANQRKIHKSVIVREAIYLLMNKAT